VAIGKKSLIHSGSKGRMISLLRKHPEQFIGQSKLNIKKEFRVRTVGGKVVAVVDRYSPLNKIIHPISGLSKNENVMGIIPKSHRFGDAKKLKKLVESHRKLFNLSGSKSRNADSYAFDIAKVKKNGGGYSYKVIEANAVGGGDLDNPIISSRVYRTLTGKPSNVEKTVKLTSATGLAVAAPALLYKKRAD
jgi:hypothetical protein